MPHEHRGQTQRALHGQQILDVVEELVEGIDVTTFAPGLAESSIVEAQHIETVRRQVRAHVLVATAVLADAVYQDDRGPGIGRLPMPFEPRDAVSPGFER